MFFSTAYKKTKITILLLLTLAAAFWSWLQPEKAAPETLFYGGPIVSMDPANPAPEAVLIRGQSIIAAGSLNDLQEKAGARAATYNLNGQTLLPGLIEPHAHPITTALFAATIDVSGFRYQNRAEIVSALKHGIDDVSGDNWAIAFGWDPVMLADLDPPTLQELDNWAPDRPLLILTQMMHDVYVNSAAFKAAGIDKNTPNPVGGEFVKDKDGNLTGTVREIAALAQIFAAAPPPPAGAADLLLHLQYAAYARAGYTTVTTMGPVANTADPIALLKNVSSAAPVRGLTYALPTQLNATENSPEAPVGNGAVIGVKFWMDGSPFAGGAAFADGYEETELTTDRLHLKPGHMAEMNYDTQAYEDLFQEYHRRGFQIATHVQGELAVERVLDAAEKVLGEFPRPDHRHRLEHNALITSAQLERAAKLGITTSFFADHLYYYGHALPDIVGEERLARYMPVKTALNAGHKVTVHTDNPATPVNALRAMQTLRARKNRATGATISPQEKLSPYEALEAMTINAAWQLGIENETGSLTPGKRADLLILSANPLTTEDEQLQELTVVKTWLAGIPADTRTLTPVVFDLGFNVLWNLVTGN